MQKCFFPYYCDKLPALPDMGYDNSYGKTAAKMQMVSTFLETGKNFMGETANGIDDTQWILEDQDYPRLWWEASN